MNLYFPNDHYDKQYRSHVFPLLKPYLKNEGFTDEQRIALYGVSEKDYTFVNTVAEASVVILPMSWGYYLFTKQLQKAEKLIDKAAKYNKKVLLVTVGDYGSIIPEFSNVLVLRTSGEHLKLRDSNQGIPVFIDDPMQRVYGTKTIWANYTIQPIIGFCGQTNSSLINAVSETVKVMFRNIKYYLKLSTQAPQKIQSTSFKRSKVLSIIKKAPKLTANFIERKKYRAGVVSDSDRRKTELEFYDNMINSNYVVCIRGAGNFSVRLYETLAMGRIPVFINTDCLLPLPKGIEWKKHVVWIESNKIYKMEEKIVAFHNNLSEEQFKRLQLSNRKLWETKLTLGGFFNSYLKTIRA